MIGSIDENSLRFYQDLYNKEEITLDSLNNNSSPEEYLYYLTTLRESGGFTQYNLVNVKEKLEGNDNLSDEDLELINLACSIRIIDNKEELVELQNSLSDSEERGTFLLSIPGPQRIFQF